MYEDHFNRIPENKDAEMRPYQAKDIPVLCAMAEKFVPEMPSYIGITVDKDRFAYLLRHHEKNSQSFAGWVLVDENDLPIGLIGGTISPSFLSHDKIANDSWLFVLPGWRTMKNGNKLVSAYKSWALKMGATLIRGSCSGGYRPEEMRAFMKRNGFELVGDLFHIRTDQTTLVKQLNALKGLSNVGS